MMKKKNKEKEFFLKIRREADFYCENFLNIRTKTEGVKKLKFNSAQRRVYDIICELKRQGKPIKLVILKARQQGISTMTEGLIFHDTATRKLRRSLIISHDPQSTDNLFDMVKMFYDDLPPELAPTKRYSNKKRLVFEIEDAKTNKVVGGLRSRIDVATAHKVDPRGWTLNNLHGSEVAFWPNAETLMLAALQMIPNHSDTMTILESTANGVGGYFYDMYWQAKKGGNDFVAVFLPWFSFPEYSMPVTPDFVRTLEEDRLKEAFSLTDEQLAWRRWCIANNCGGDLNRFRQEYPSTDQEAFIVSGTPEFNLTNLQLYYNFRKKPLFVGEIESMDTREAVKKPQLIEQFNGRLRIYEFPSISCAYVIGGDVAKGTPTSDYSCLQVINRNTGDLVATWHGKINESMFAFVAARLGYYYAGGRAGALVGIEVNQRGKTTNDVLYYEIKYPFVYHRQSLDSITKKQVKKLGFHTSGTTRMPIIGDLARWINEGEFGLHDETTIMECMTFVKDEQGKPQAQDGCYDDAVMALAIAIFMYNCSTPLPKPKSDFEKLIIQRKKQLHGTPKW